MYIVEISVKEGGSLVGLVAMQFSLQRPCDAESDSAILTAVKESRTKNSDLVVTDFSMRFKLKKHELDAIKKSAEELPLVTVEILEEPNTEHP